jgi:broad specificity phosphatase PhoE
MTVVYLVRHGETTLNTEGRLQGGTIDAPLTAKGESQVEAIASLLARELAGRSSPIRLQSSPLGRALATARIIAARVPTTPTAIDERLREIDFGRWTGLTFAEIEQTDAALWVARQLDPWHIRSPGGESYSDVSQRACDWLAAQTSDVIAVAHGVFGRVLRGTVLGLNGGAIRKLSEHHTDIVVIEAGTVQVLSA